MHVVYALELKINAKYFIEMAAVCMDVHSTFHETLLGMNFWNQDLKFIFVAYNIKHYLHCHILISKSHFIIITYLV